MNDLSRLPSVDSLLSSPEGKALISEFGRDLALHSIRAELEMIRNRVVQGEPVPDAKAIIKLSKQRIAIWLNPSLIPVINASGIIIHTNLGRAPLSQDTILAMDKVSRGYSNLEYELKEGKRGKRSIHAEGLLRLLTGAESALVVNNNAAAVLLVLSALASHKRVVIANSQLVEIGGGFRVPDVMRQSGAKLLAIGTTNRVHLSDYEAALKESPALVLSAHHSNFKIIGFTTEPDLSEIARVCRAHEIPFVYDIGSGAMLETERYGLMHEPTIQEAMQAGVDVICFSGDKLLGGPQAGIIIGRNDLLEKVKKHPLARAVRADKLCLAGISATLIHYLKGEALEKIPVWRMISMNIGQIKTRAESWNSSIGSGEIIPGFSMVGGGSLPEESLPTYLLSMDVNNPEKFVKKLRELDFPIIARIENDRVLFDPRTVLPEQEEIFIKEMRQLRI
ncbi:MAG: L-seryl-tRNA(Sec) selenium transferase [Chloroflexi bacterium]|nr:L-seryl-tRNA(Sec) selenium transferase [Chloroflexota bacterium]